MPAMLDPEMVRRHVCRTCGVSWVTGERSPGRPAMLDPEVVLELRRTVAHWRRGSIDSLNVVADGIEALLADWERRGEALRKIRGQAVQTLPTGESYCRLCRGLGKHAQDCTAFGGKP